MTVPGDPPKAQQPEQPLRTGQPERPEPSGEGGVEQRTANPTGSPGQPMGPTSGAGRRELAVAVGLVALGAAVALLGGGRSATTTPGVPTAPGADTGTSGATALALVALAGAGALLLVRNRARVVLGVVIVGIAVALAAVGASPVHWSALIGAAPVALGGLLVVLRARHWPQPRGRYDQRPPRATGTPRDTWDALDRGEDPTA